MKSDRQRKKIACDVPDRQNKKRETKKYIYNSKRDSENSKATNQSQKKKHLRGRDKCGGKD